jgi:hypothetical protein
MGKPFETNQILGSKVQSWSIQCFYVNLHRTIKTQNFAKLMIVTGPSVVRVMITKAKCTTTHNWLMPAGLPVNGKTNSIKTWQKVLSLTHVVAYQQFGW